jgi:MOSC domain-containing protein YiiM
MPQITATCITQRLRAHSATDDRPSGIDKGPVESIVASSTGVEGDRVLDTAHHGGADKALYAYADEDAQFWERELCETIPAGRFGENVRTIGIDLNELTIGTRLLFGAVEVEAAMPRIPCATFKHHMDDRTGWVKTFTLENRTGVYLRVLVPGAITEGDAVHVLDVPNHGVTVAAWFSERTRAQAQALLGAESDGWTMGADLRGYVQDTLAAT